MHIYHGFYVNFDFAYAAVNCSALQGVPAHCSVLRCVAACCSVLQSCSVMQRVAVCCIYLHSYPILPLLSERAYLQSRHPLLQHPVLPQLQCLTVCCSVLQCFTVCCSVLQWVAMGCSGL